MVDVAIFYRDYQALHQPLLLLEHTIQNQAMPTSSTRTGQHAGLIQSSQVTSVSPCLFQTTGVLILASWIFRS